MQQKKNNRLSDKKAEGYQEQTSSQTALLVPPNTITALEKRQNSKTKVIVKYNCGFGNSLFIRGKGANLNWSKGVQLRNVKDDEWIWETELPFSGCEFKILVNDSEYETGDNHPLTAGSTIQFTPRFASQCNL